jgi:hypothetical protein
MYPYQQEWELLETNKIRSQSKLDKTFIFSKLTRRSMKSNGKPNYAKIGRKQVKFFRTNPSTRSMQLWKKMSVRSRQTRTYT